VVGKSRVFAGAVGVIPHHDRCASGSWLEPGLSSFWGAVVLVLTVGVAFAPSVSHSKSIYG